MKWKMYSLKWLCMQHSDLRPEFDICLYGFYNIRWLCKLSIKISLVYMPVVSLCFTHFVIVLYRHFVWFKTSH